MRNVVALFTVLALAGAASAATITVANLGSPDYTAYGPPVYTTLQRLMFTVAKEAGESQINAASINVTATEAVLHQVFGESGFMGVYTYTDSADPGDVNPLLQVQWTPIWLIRCSR